MERVLGIGGFSFTSMQPERVARWYAQLHDPDGNPVQLWQHLPPERDS